MNITSSIDYVKVEMIERNLKILYVIIYFNDYVLNNPNRKAVPYITPNFDT